LYESALARTKEISELDQIVAPGARVIAPGLPLEGAVWPKKKLLVALAGILGLLLGTALAIGGEAVRQVAAQIGPRPAVPEAVPADAAPAYAAAPDPALAWREPEPAPVADTVVLQPAPRAPVIEERNGAFSLLNVQSGAK
ncbi:MAG: hypothetical protein WAU86_11280, partial [Oricola sp.]